MAIGDIPNQNLFGTNYNAEEEERKKAELAAQNARMGAGSVPASAFGQAPAVAPFSMEAAGQVNPMLQPQNLESFAQPQALAELPVEATADDSVRAGRYQQRQGELDRREPTVTTTENNVGFFSPGGFGYEYLGGRLGENIGEFAGKQKYGTGLTAEGQVTGFPVDRPSLAGDLLTLPGTALNVVGDFVTDPLIAGSKLAQNVASYATGATGVQSQQAEQAAQAASDLVATPSVTPPAESLATGAQEQGQSIPQGAPGSAQANFATRMATGEALTPQEIQDAQSFAASMGTTFDPATGYSREPFENAQQAQGQVPTAPMPGQSLSQFMRYEDSPEQRTEQFLDAQGRLRRRLTPTAAQLRGEPVGSQPLADQYQSYEREVEKAQARLSERDIRPGESQADRDTRIARGQTTGGQTEGLSFDDARRRAEGDLAERGVKNPSASQVNALARALQAEEPERLAELETKRAKDAVDLKTAQATLDRPEFEGRVYTVNGVTFAQTSRGGAQVIDTGTETSEESTAKMKDFVFALEQIDKARKAYQAGDVNKANDIITAAGIQKNGFDVTASEYFGGSAPSVTDSGLTQQQEADITRQAFDTMEEAEAANLRKGTKITIGGRNATV